MGVGEATISRSAVNGNQSGGYGGGAFFSSATTRISKTTIASNHAGVNGGGIANFSELKITGSTISRNRTGPASNGGGIANSGADGAIRMVNDTVANNQATKNGGGIDNRSMSSVRMNAVTVARNRSNSDNVSGGQGGGLYEAGLASYLVQNSLIALNSAGSATGPDCWDEDANGIGSQGHNLVGDNGDCDGFSTNALPSDRVNVGPRIALLRDNGGPTKTIALRRHSPAINHASSNAPRRDQRGHKRDKHPDIGAFER